MTTSSKERVQRMRERRIAAGVCVRCKGSNPGKGQLCRDCLDRRKAWYKQSDYRTRHAQQRADEKRLVTEQYGGKCACCGESEPCFLAIDHIEGNGNSHRKKIGKWGSGFFKWLIKNDFPDGFQILCHNCNMGKHLNGGVCPHQQTK